MHLVYPGKTEANSRLENSVALQAACAVPATWKTAEMHLSQLCISEPSGSGLLAATRAGCCPADAVALQAARAPPEPR